MQQTKKTIKSEKLSENNLSETVESLNLSGTVRCMKKESIKSKIAPENGSGGRIISDFSVFKCSSLLITIVIIDLRLLDYAKHIWINGIRIHRR